MVLSDEGIDDDDMYKFDIHILHDVFLSVTMGSIFFSFLCQLIKLWEMVYY
jgi:hypothetical protein